MTLIYREKSGDLHKAEPKKSTDLERQIFRGVLKALLVAGLIFACAGGCLAACSYSIHEDQTRQAEALERLQQRYGR